MASVIKVKRSRGVAKPSSLNTGELAYSFGTTGGPATYENNGGRLFIGAVGSDAGGGLNAVETEPLVIGGKYFTDMLSQQPGILTASSALIVDANSKINEFKVDNLLFNDGTISTVSSTTDSGNITITPFPGVTGGSRTVITNIYSYYPTESTAISLIEYITKTVSGNFGSGAGQISINAEAVEDIVGAMVTTGNTESGISVTYEDNGTGNGKLNFNVNDPVITISGDVDGFATMSDLADVTINVTLDTVNQNVGTFPTKTVLVDGTPTSFTDPTKIPVITVNAKGLVTGVGTADIASELTVKADGATTQAVSLLTETLEILGGTGISTVVTANSNPNTVTTITINGDDATATSKGIASFNSTNFSVTNGAVSTSNITIGSTVVNNGSTTNSLSGLVTVGVGNLSLTSNTISSTTTNGNIVISPNGSGQIDVSDSVITGLADPVQPTDAVNKRYADSARSGLSVKLAVKAATTAPVDLVTGGTIVIDGVQSIAAGDRILVKDQADKKFNGIYVVNAGGTWSRAPDADTSAEVTSGMFTFVEQGAINGDSGFVLITDNPIELGATALDFALFSVSGTVIAGSGLVKVGDTLSVGAGNGITVDVDTVALNSSVAGNGLTYTAGVLDVVGTANRISVTANAVDISASYIGQNTITTLGTIGTGTWNGTTITVPNGGTGLTTVTTKGILYGDGTNNLKVTAAGTYNSTSGMGQLLMAGADGPVWTNTIDGGTYA